MSQAAFIALSPHNARRIVFVISILVLADLPRPAALVSDEEICSRGAKLNLSRTAISPSTHISE
jgi:hypothetical protein